MRKFAIVRLNLKRDSPRRSSSPTGFKHNQIFQIIGKITKAATTTKVGISIKNARRASCSKKVCDRGFIVVVFLGNELYLIENCLKTSFLLDVRNCINI